MWKRDEAVSRRPVISRAAPAPAPAPARRFAPFAVDSSQPDHRRIERDVVNIGKSVVIRVS